MLSGWNLWWYWSLCTNNTFKMSGLECFRRCFLRLWVGFNSNTAVWWGVAGNQKQQLWFEYSPYLHPPPSDNTPPAVFYLCILHPSHLIQYTSQLYSTAQQTGTHSTQPVGTSKGAVEDSPHPGEGLTTPSAFKPGNLNIGFSSTLTTPAGDI